MGGPARARALAHTLLATALACGLASPAAAAPPTAGAEAPPAPTVTVEGWLREAGGSRAPIGGAKVVLVDASAAGGDFREGRPARAPLDPDTLTWVVEAQTDAEGRFVLAEVPPGRARLVVVAGGYARLDQWVVIGDDAPLDLFLAPEVDGVYRTEVAVERAPVSTPTHVLDGQQARHYAGGGDDPVLVALNLPGVARTPGGFGLLSLRGGNPTETGVYLDGHPIPRAFHIIPIASVLSPPMTGRVEISPGSYGPGYGSFSAGLVEIDSRAGRRDGIHGEAHLDLFDVGATAEGPVGDGSVHVGVRRSHVDGVLLTAERVTGPLGVLLPNYWDYLGRFDHPIGPGQQLTVRALGAGDRIRGRTPEPSAGPAPNPFEFTAAFHRFDLDYRLRRGPWRLLVSPSVRLDHSRLSQTSLLRRDATVGSGRVELERELGERVTLQIGSDLVYERWRRRERFASVVGADFSDDEQIGEDRKFDGEQARVGAWLAARVGVGGWSLVPSLRLNVFHYAGRTLVRPDPRLDVRGEVHPQVAVFARAGLFAVPVVVQSGGYEAGLVQSGGEIFGGLADVPSYLIAYFDPGVEGEVRDGSAGAAYAIQAAAGLEASLPWELDLRATGFYREVQSTTVPVYFDDGTSTRLASARRRSGGAELLLRRALGPRVDGWIGYTLMWARQQRVIPDEPAQPWRPAIFDQRHNLVVLLSSSLPRGFRLGLRFRLVSGNPESPVLAGEQSSSGLLGVDIRPIEGELGSRYQPLFHQLDLRLDKQWVRDRATVGVYLDVQNVYNRMYPEVPIYTADWSDRASLIGLPIFPSLGVQVQY